MNMQADRHYMELALALAAEARGRTSPNPMVGACLVRDGRIVGRGYHTRAGAPHAEVLALMEAGTSARGATLYVNLEPCSHYGRTGPCCEAVIGAGVARVVAAMTDPNPLVAGEGFRRLNAAGVEVTVGVLEEEARQLNETFIKYITTGMPFVLAKAAVSLDGKIATRSGRSKWITGPAARAYTHSLRDTYDAVLVGIGTVLADNPSLTTRLPEGNGRDPVRVILDSLARTPLNSMVLSGKSRAAAIVAVTGAAPEARRKALQQAGACVLVVNEGSRVDLNELGRSLARMEITSLLVEGGSEVHGSYISAGLADKAAWFIAPKIIGGRDAPGPVGGPGVDEPDEAWHLERVSVRQLGSDILVEGYFADRSD